MRFPRMFKRYDTVIPPGGHALGSDTTPTTTPPTASVTDNLMVSRFSNINGWPCHRVAVVYRGPPGAPPLPAELYMWEEQTQHWYQIGAPVSLVPGAVAFFDVVGVLDGNDALTPTAGSIAVFLRVTDPGGTPAGEYVFAVAPDLTTY